MNTEGLMQAVFEWIRNLTGFFLFMSVMDHLMPEKTYRVYIRLFAGLVFILLVLQPFTGNRRLEERIAQYYESNLFRYETGELKENLLGIEEKRRAQIASQYEAVIGQEISRMAQIDGFEVAGCWVEINQDVDSEQFGEIMGVRVEVCSARHEQGAESARTERGQDDGSSGSGENLQEKETWENLVGYGKDRATGNIQIQIPKIAVEGMEKVEAAGARENKKEDPNKTQGKSQNAILGENQSVEDIQEDTARAVSGPVYQKIGELRSRISSYCGVEERNVEIGVVEEKR
ncbi:stage III sporulation protein AF [Brotaphodocola sp.]|uniref:stage III sporulation protein AF n=1 Tax=Brotaphodocola sp. TaxID=3073577 RepID=UPI003D7C89D4